MPTVKIEDMKNLKTSRAMSPEMTLKGRITDWNRDRGFGYLGCDGRRVFLHIRDFKEHHKQPEVADVIYFVMGADKQGRPCAQQAVHANDGGSLKPVHLLILVFLVLPGLAVYRELGPKAAAYAGGWVVVMSVFSSMMYAWDKRQARVKGWRESENMLHLFELLGGWPGAFFAQRKLRHKSSKGPYQFVFVLIIGLHQFLAIDALRGWPFVQLVFKTVR